MMVEMFKRCNFLLHVASKQSYDEGFRFTENNIIQYLAELEEYIAALITYTAWKLNAPNHATSFIPFDALPVKEFKDHDPNKALTVSHTNTNSPDHLRCRRAGHVEGSGGYDSDVRRCDDRVRESQDAGAARA